MKKIIKLMESTTKYAIRPFLLLTLIMIILNVVTFLYLVFKEPSSYIDVHHDTSLLIVWMLCAVFVLHIRRLRRNDIGITRIRLLPISPTTYFYSELIFVLGTLCILLAGYYISIILIYVLHNILVTPLENGYIYMILLNKTMTKLIPFTIGNILLLLAQVLLVGLSITLMGMSLSSKVFIRNCLFLFLGVIVAVLINTSLPAMGSYTHKDKVYGILYCLPFLIDALLFWYGTYMFKKHMIGG